MPAPITVPLSTSRGTDRAKCVMMYNAKPDAMIAAAIDASVIHNS